MGCNLKRGKEIDKDIRDFIRAKKRGHPMPWAAFVRTYINAEYKLNLKPHTLRGHALRCLRLEA
jgi:hypothetical protein